MRIESAPKTEAVLVQRVLDRIRSLPDAWAHKVHGSRFQDAGEPDVDACVRGRAVKVEVKLPGNVPTAVQYGSLRRWERAGALAGWVDSMRGLEELLGHVDDRDWPNPQLCRHTGTPCERCGCEL